ncbi:MAG: serine--tRNA ligase [Candidatus Omnitrophica bacterium]|nr:serine--tRNA ligase [Candidatus Omnitrophota bacterium]
MLDLKWIRENPDLVKKGLTAKNVTFDLDEFLQVEHKRRSLLTEGEALKAERNRVNEEITRRKKCGEPAEEVIASMKSVAQKIKEIDAEVGALEENLTHQARYLPNMPHESVPVARGAEGNAIVRSWGEPRTFPFKAKTHLELGADKGRFFSMDWGSKIAGSGFPVYVGEGARLERALINFMIDLHVSRHGYQEIWPPALVNRDSMVGTGQLPKMEEDMYKLRDDEFYLIPTAEVPVTNLLRNEILEESELPKKFVAYTPCFRREAGSYGKDTKGLSRVHQFDKVEMVKFVKPENSLNELEDLVKNAEAVLQALELPYRVVLLGSGDMSFAAAKCYDLEVWAPGTEKWFEVSSCSTFWDFQARRANIRYRNKETKKPEFVHTLNGSGVALARIFLALLENFQTADGTIEFPKALRPYMGRGAD